MEYEHECKRCGKQWRSVVATPVVCPKCHSRSWMKPWPELTKCECKRCGKKWDSVIPGGPGGCPRCRSRKWRIEPEPVAEHQCKRCGYEWEAAGRPSMCPKCKKQAWDVVMYSHTCVYCNYTWESRVKNTVLCPKCNHEKWSTGEPQKHRGTRRYKCLKCGEIFPQKKAKNGNRCPKCGSGKKTRIGIGGKPSDWIEHKREVNKFHTNKWYHKQKPESEIPCKA